MKIPAYLERLDCGSNDASGQGCRCDFTCEFCKEAVAEAVYDGTPCCLACGAAKHAAELHSGLCTPTCWRAHHPPVPWAASR